MDRAQGWCARHVILAPIALALSLLAPSLAFGDSPLTSTDWHLAYSDVTEVTRARGAKLDERTFAALRDPATPYEVRAAIVSAMGWTSGGKASAYRSMLERITGPAEPTSAVDLFNLGFLMAFDDYFHTSGALTLLERAATLEPDDQAVSMARALVAAQGLLDEQGRWCEVFRVADVVARGTWRKPMRQAGVDQVMRYMRGYEEYCHDGVAPVEADAANKEALRKAAATLVGRFVEYDTVVEGRKAAIVALVRSISSDPSSGYPVAVGIRLAGNPFQGRGITCSEEILDLDMQSLRVLEDGALVRFGATLDADLRRKLYLSDGPGRRDSPSESLLAQIRECARRTDKSPLQSITVHVRRTPYPTVGETPEALPLLDFTYGFDGAEHTIEEELGEDWSEIGFSVVMRPGFPIGELTVENSNITVMHCSDEGGWTTLGFKTGATSWQKLKRKGNEFAVGPMRVAPFPPYTQAELNAANTNHFAECRPTLGGKRYRVRFRGKTIKTIVIIPALGC